MLSSTTENSIIAAAYAFKGASWLKKRIEDNVRKNIYINDTPIDSSTGNLNDRWSPIQLATESFFMGQGQLGTDILKKTIGTFTSGATNLGINVISEEEFNKLSLTETGLSGITYKSYIANTLYKEGYGVLQDIQSIIESQLESSAAFSKFYQSFEVYSEFHKIVKTNKIDENRPQFKDDLINKIPTGYNHLEWFHKVEYYLKIKPDFDNWGKGQLSFQDKEKLINIEKEKSETQQYILNQMISGSESGKMETSGIIQNVFGNQEVIEEQWQNIFDDKDNKWKWKEYEIINGEATGDFFLYMDMGDNKWKKTKLNNMYKIIEENILTIDDKITEFKIPPSDIKHIKIPSRYGVRFHTYEIGQTDLGRKRLLEFYKFKSKSPNPEEKDIRDFFENKGGCEDYSNISTCNLFSEKEIEDLKPFLEFLRVEGLRSKAGPWRLFTDENMTTGERIQAACSMYSILAKVNDVVYATTGVGLGSVLTNAIPHFEMFDAMKQRESYIAEVLEGMGVNQMTVEDDPDKYARMIKLAADKVEEYVQEYGDLTTKSIASVVSSIHDVSLTLAEQGKIAVLMSNLNGDYENKQLPDIPELVDINSLAREILRSNSNTT